MITGMIVGIIFILCALACFVEGGVIKGLHAVGMAILGVFCGLGIVVTMSACIYGFSMLGKAIHLP